METHIQVSVVNLIMNQPIPAPNHYKWVGFQPSPHGRVSRLKNIHGGGSNMFQHCSNYFCPLWICSSRIIANSWWTQHHVPMSNGSSLKICRLSWFDTSKNHSKPAPWSKQGITCRYLGLLGLWPIKNHQKNDWISRKSFFLDNHQPNPIAYEKADHSG